MDSARRYAAGMGTMRIAVGVAAVAAPGALMTGLGAPAEFNTPALRYWARLFGVRNTALGLQILHARRDPERLRELATLNAGVELADLAAGSVIAVQVPEMRRTGFAVMVTSVTAAAGFVGLRAVTRRRVQ